MMSSASGIRCNRKKGREGEIMVLSRLIAVIMALVLSVSAVFLTVYADNDVNIDYEGEIDPYSGEPLDGESSGSEQNVAVMSGVSYDRKAHLFRYAVPSSADVISCNIANGMVTTEDVYLDIPASVTAVLYQDGEALEDVDFSKIRDNGSYSLVISDSETKTQFLTFSIVSEKTGALTVFQVPKGFSLVNVMLDGEKQKYSLGANTVDLKSEGEYEIEYRCDATAIKYSISLTVDHTPPQVTFSGVNNGVARNPVTIEGVEKSDTVKVIADGVEINISKDHIIRSPGNYTVSVTDDAGNSVTEEFRIQFYLNEQGLFFGLLVVAIIVMAIVYMLMSRKKLRVR